MRILHSSDTHGGFPGAYYRFRDPFDVWVDSGDFFPNLGRPINPDLEREFQEAWIREKIAPMARWLDGRPMLVVAGNHDFANLAQIARQYGIDAHDLSEKPVELAGQTFAGFREIPYIIGEWAGEVFDFEAILDRVFGGDPTILVSHSPPAGILDGVPPSKDLDGEPAPRYGCGALATRLAYHRHRVHTHLFGHVHVSGGDSMREMGINFYNGATQVRNIEVS